MEETLRPETETTTSPVKAGGGQAHDCWRRRTWRRAAGVFLCILGIVFFFWFSVNLIGEIVVVYFIFLISGLVS